MHEALPTVTQGSTQPSKRCAASEPNFGRRDIHLRCLSKGRCIPAGRHKHQDIDCTQQVACVVVASQQPAAARNTLVYPPAICRPLSLLPPSLSPPKESNTVNVDVVQREKIARLTKWERAAVSAFADDMLDWCTNDILRTTQEALRWTDEEEICYY